MPLIAGKAVEGIQIGQPAKSRSLAKQLHRPSAVIATPRFGRGLVGVVVVHDTISNQTSYSEKERVRIGDVVLEHYRRVAGNLTFGKMSLGQ